MVLRIRRELIERIIGHCMEVFPEECCGLLIGLRVGDRISVEDVRRARNVYPHDRRVGYVVDPLDYLGAEREAERSGLEVVGVYHSHIWIEPVPSARDLEQAIPGYVYLIVSVGGRPAYRAWTVQREGERFVEETIEVV